MALSDKLLTIAFFGEKISKQERTDAIGALAVKIAYQSIHSPQALLDATVVAGIQPIKALIMDYNPQDHAEATWVRVQALSKRVLSLDAKFAWTRGLGASTETAVHNLIWYGIAKHSGGRYARLTTHAEDGSSAFGRLDGYDLVHRTDRRRWKIQAKTVGCPDEIINSYAKDIIVVSPGILTGSTDGLTADIHTAIADSDENLLDSMWHNYVHQLRTQKAPNGVRKVI